MKKSTLFIAAGLTLIAAALLFPCPHETSGASASPTSKPTKLAHRLSGPAQARPSRSERVANDGEATNLAAWQNRFDILLAEKGDRNEAILQLLQEIDALYHAWVSDQLLPVVERAPGERYDELTDIEHSVSEGTAAILDQLGIEDGRRLDASGSPAEMLSAEVQYAEAARDSDSRLALLRLDRERQSRLEQVLALGDEAAKIQAIDELDAWYDAGLGKIFAAPDTGSDDEEP